MKYIITDKIVKKYNIPKQEVERLILPTPWQWDAIFNELEEEFLIKLNEKQRKKCFNSIDEQLRLYNKSELDGMAKTIKEVIIKTCTSKCAQKFQFYGNKRSINFIYIDFNHFIMTNEDKKLIGKCLDETLIIKNKELRKLKLDNSDNDKEIMNEFMQKLRNEFDKLGLNFVGITYEIK